VVGRRGGVGAVAFGVSTPAVVLLVLLLRLPFLHQAVQGDDPYYLYGAEHALIDPLHPTQAQYFFQGEFVDMRGHPHGPMNSWILAAPMALLGGVREVPFHTFYIVFSLVAALSMLSLARRFCNRPLLATLLFMAVPAFVVNGTSFEADLPFLALWMLAIALFVTAVDRNSPAALAGSAIAAALAALTAYQAIFLIPVCGLYLFERRRQWTAGWIALLAAPLAIALWQLFERTSSGEFPAAILIGYMQSHRLQVPGNKLRSAAALIVHSGWIVCPLILLAAFLKGPSKWRWILAAAAAGSAALYDPNPLFWFSFGCGILLLASCIGRGFLGTWILVFFAGGAIIFFAGSARYLLPIAAPVAILVVRECSKPVLVTGLALQMALSLGLAMVNSQHWDAYRQFSTSLAREVDGHRVWVNAEWGLRWYLELEGALPLPRDRNLQPNEIVVTSELALPLPTNAPLSPLAETEIRPRIPLRTVSLDRRSAYSSASNVGLLPFEISTGPIDRVKAQIVLERKPQLTSIKPVDPLAATQIVSGLYPDGWMTDQATILLKRPPLPAPLRAEIYIPPQAPGRHVRMLVDGQLVAEETFAGPGSYAITVPATGGPSTATVTLTVDQTFSAPQDQRKLGILILAIGFR
jgi:hypothetical protein